MMKVSEFIEKFNSKTPNYTWMSKSELEDYVIKTCAWIGRHYACDEDRNNVINDLNQRKIRIKENTEVIISFGDVIPIDGIKSIKGGWQRILEYKLILFSEFIPDGVSHYASELNFSYFDNAGADGGEGETLYMSNTGFLEDSVYNVDKEGNVKLFRKNHLI